MKEEVLKSLQEECIWITPAILREDYERVLVEASEHHAILFQKVTTLSLFYQEILKSQEQFHIHKIAKIDKTKAIVKIIVENHYQHITLEHYDQAVEMIETLMQYRIAHLPDLSGLPRFTREKLLESFDLYSKYCSYLKENDLYDLNYDIIIEKENRKRKVYVAGYDRMTPNEKNFLDQFDVVYVKEDINNPIIEEYSMVNSQAEIRHVLHDIVVKVNQGAKLSEFMVYMPSDYEMKMQLEMKKYHIPFNGKEKVTDPVASLIRLIEDYLITGDESLLIDMLYFTEEKMEDVWECDRSCRQFGNSKTGFKNSVALLYDCKTMYEYSITLARILDSIPKLRSLENYEEARTYILAHDLDLPMKYIEYFNIVLAHFPELVQEYHQLDVLNYGSIENMYSPKKYTYILGCNEEKFPMVSKDSGLLLNEGKRAFHIPDLIADIESEKQLIDHIIGQCYYLQLSYPISNLKGESLLESTYLLELSKKYLIERKKVKDEEIASIEAEMDKLMEMDHPTVQSIKQMANQYHTTFNQPDKVLVNKPREVSVSEIETYNGCPFKYFMAYDLKIKKWQNGRMQITDFGTLRHDICEQCAPYINGEQQNIDPLIHSICTSQKKNVLNSNDEVYYINQIEKQMKLAVRVLRYQNSTTDFMVSEHEVNVCKERGSYSLHGRFDRKDTYDHYARIIDYKSSDKALNLELARQGFNIQMLLYLDMIDEEAAGVLYFNLSQRILKKQVLSLKPEENQNQMLDDFYKEYKMKNGLVVEDEKIIQAMANCPEAVNVVPVSMNKDGTISKKSKVISKEDLDSLLDEIYAHIDEIINGIFEEGNIRIDPAVGENKNVNHIVDPCTYCDYDRVCLKDIFYNSGREIRIGGESDEQNESRSNESGYQL